MSILNTTPTDPATAAANAVRNIVRQQYVQLAQSGVNGYRAIWNNPNASPAQVINALGTDALAVFTLAQLNISTIQSAATACGATAPSIPSIPPQFSLSFNTDGSAVLTDNTSSSSSGS